MTKRHIRPSRTDAPSRTQRRIRLILLATPIIAVSVVGTIMLGSGTETPAGRAAGGADTPVTPTAAPSTSESAMVAGARSNSNGSTSESAEDTDDEVAAAAGRALTRFLQISDDVLQASDGTLGREVDAVARGAAKAELEATLQEFTANDWRQEGAVTMTGQRTVAVERDAHPPTIALQVCIDSTDVRVVDESGTAVSARGEVSRFPHLYTMELIGQRWKVATHSFPNASSC